MSLSVSFGDRCLHSFSCIPTRLSGIFIGSIVLIILFFEILLFSSTQPFWNSGGLILGFDASFNRTTSLYGSDGLFGFTKSLCLLNLNNSVVWLAIRIPYTDKADCNALTNFKAIWKILYTIPYFWALSFFWCLSSITIIMTCITLIKTKSKIITFIGGNLNIFGSISLTITVILFWLLMYTYFIKYIQDIPPSYINICFIILHTIAIIGILSTPLIMIVKGYYYKHRYTDLEYENIQ